MKPSATLSTRRFNVIWVVVCLISFFSQKVNSQVNVKLVPKMMLSVNESVTASKIASSPLTTPLVVVPPGFNSQYISVGVSFFPFLDDKPLVFQSVMTKVSQYSIRNVNADGTTSTHHENGAGNNEDESIFMYGREGSSINSAFFTTPTSDTTTPNSPTNSQIENARVGNVGAIHFTNFRLPMGSPDTPRPVVDTGYQIELRFKFECKFVDTAGVTRLTYFNFSRSELRFRFTVSDKTPVSSAIITPSTQYDPAVLTAECPWMHMYQLESLCDQGWEVVQPTPDCIECTDPALGRFKWTLKSSDFEHVPMRLFRWRHMGGKPQFQFAVTIPQ